MKTLFLYLFPLLLVLGGALFGWLARWYKYGGRCGAGGLSDGVPNVDIQGGTVRLDGTEPAVTIGERTAEVSAGSREALGSLKAGYAEGKTATTTPDSPADGSTAAKVGAVVGGAAAAVGAGIASASSTVRDATGTVTDSAKSGIAAMKGGYSEGKAPGETSDAPADDSVAAKLGAAVGGAVTTVKETAASAVDSTKSTVASLKDGSAKATVDDATGSDVAGTTSPAATIEDGNAEGKSPGETPDAPADGPVAPKVAATAGGAVSPVEDTASSAVETTKSRIASGTGDETEGDETKGDESFPKASDPAIDGKMPASARGPSSRDASGTSGSGTAKAAAAIAGVAGTAAVAGTGQAASDGRNLAGATIGQEDGHTNGVGESPSSGKSGIDAELSTDERAALRLMEGDGELSRPATALMAPHVDRRPDDLTKIDGIGKATQRILNDEGIFYYDQIAEFGTQDVAWADRKIDGEGRVVSDRWVPQARDLAASGDGADGDASADEGAARSEVDVPEMLSDEEQEAERLIESGAEVSKPATALSTPRADRSPDDLKRIKGIGPKIESTLNGEGIYYFDQIAEFGGRDIAWADRTLAIKGRVVRDRWVPQAKGLAALGPNDADTGGLRSRFAALSDEAEDDADIGSGMDAGVIDIPDTLSDAEQEANRLIESGEEVGRPQSALDKPEKNRAVDDLKLISGIGPKIERTLNDEGIFYFDQIADFGGRDLAWADRTLGFKGRVVRDRWVPQARGLAAHRDRTGLGTAPAWRGAEGASGDAPANTPLRIAEAEALRLIERDGGYAATSQNRPASLMQDGPVSGKPDDLKRISGIGEKLETVLNGFGVYYFRQIAGLTANDIAWLDSKLNFKGRIIRDRWVPQAEKFEKTGKA